MLHSATALARGRVSPLVPLAALVAAAVAVADNHAAVGIGVAAGGLLAYVNGLLLSRRVDLAADSGNMAAALLIMQLGLLVSLTIMAIATVILARYSLAAAVGEIAGFAGAHVLILVTYYWTHARRMPARERSA